MVWGSIPARRRDFFLILICPHRLWGTLSQIFNGYRVSFPRIKQQRLKDENTLSYSAEIKNEWSYSSAPFYAFMA